jgi:hypothetical protein
MLYTGLSQEVGNDSTPNFVQISRFMEMKSTISLVFTWPSIPSLEHFPCGELIFNNNVNCK